MSAIPPKADIDERDCHVRFVLDSDTYCDQNGLFDHLVGEDENVRRKFAGREPDGFEITMVPQNRG